MKTRLLIITFLVFVSIPLIYAQEQSLCSFEKDVPLSENYFLNDPTVVEFLKLYPEAKYMTDNGWEDPLPPQTYAQYLFKDLHLVFQILEYNPENTQECYFINGYKLFNQYTPNLNVLNFQKDPNVIIELLDTIKPRIRAGPQNIDAMQLERSTDDYHAPLKQIKSGVALIDVKCNEGKLPVYKYNRLRVACVTDETASELIVRGWALLRLIMPGENISHALCNNYEGKWHPEHEGCRDITDLQCSLMGGKFVDDLKICYDEICPVDKTYTLCITNHDLISGEKENEN